ncbi:LOW QUALITY PROTEIN: uncharacterized protein Dere_GG14155 [Drosophila erecta]|uniref:Uncharacterized protein n=1 Tax=Drosophila erecta TaxID=7220 RepID=B3NG72_DROER|nr:LOW QUALITY PROTEIN: uncharacterized protein Dere_GG14155 [Drosophila erecta]
MQLALQLIVDNAFGFASAANVVATHAKVSGVRGDKSWEYPGMQSHHRRRGKPGFTIQYPYAGHPPVTCLSAAYNAMQVPPTGPSGIEVPGSGLSRCSASRAMRDKYLLTATTAGHRLRGFILALEG